MPNYAEFFLNSESSIVELETIQITHPNFSKMYRIVRNAVAGLTATLEDATTGVFDYYPLKITPSGAYGDLDQTLQVSFGDLGELIPQELDRLLLQTNALVNVNQGSLLGAWCTSTGQMISPPFLIGLGGQFYVPFGATQLQLGICDAFMFDNSGNFSVVINGGASFSVPSTTRLYNYTIGLLNAFFPYSPTSSTSPVVQAVSPGQLLQISVTGTIQISGGGTLLNGFGDATVTLTAPGTYVPTLPLPAFITKPILIYRTFRSDDLSAPLYGPIAFEVLSIASTKEASTLQCAAPRLNLVSTGELYGLGRFPMLRGFL